MQLLCPTCHNPISYSVQITGLVANPMPFVIAEQGVIEVAQSRAMATENCSMVISQISCSNCKQEVPLANVHISSEISSKMDIVTNFVVGIFDCVQKMSSSLSSSSTRNKVRAVIHKDELETAKTYFTGYTFMESKPIKQIRNL